MKPGDAGASSAVATEPVEDESERAVVGTLDANMHIERISNDTLALFDLPPASLLGRPLTDVVAEPDHAELIAAVAAAATGNQSVTVYVHPARDGESTRAYQLFIVSTEPAPSCAFVIVGEASGSSGPNRPAPAERAKSRRRSDAGLGQRLRSLSDSAVPGLSALTTREWEIVTQLLDGDRVPVIAAELFLSQSTVRSHLALVFDKLGISSQQELLDLLHGKRTR